MRIKLIIIFASLFIGNVQAQLLMDIKPGIKFGQLTFIRNKTIIYENAIYKITEPKRWEKTKLCFEPELMFNFYTVDSKWLFGTGLGLYNWEMYSELGVSTGDSYLDTNRTLQASLQTKNLQISLFVSRKILATNPNSFLKENYISIGCGANVFSPIRGDVIEFPGTTFDFNQQKYLGGRLINSAAPFISFKYEAVFKRLNFNISFVKVFLNNGIIKNNAFGSGIDLESFTYSKGSGLRLGVSKTIQFQHLK